MVSAGHLEKIPGIGLGLTPQLGILGSYDAQEGLVGLSRDPALRDTNIGQIVPKAYTTSKLGRVDGDIRVTGCRRYGSDAKRIAGCRGR